MSDLTRIKQAMVDGEHTDGDLEWCVDEIERLNADCEMKDKRIDWTVAANVRNAIEIERLTAENKQLRKALDLIQSTTHWRSKPPHTENDQECMYCNASKHRKTCPISIARQALQTKDTEQGEKDE